MSDNAAKLAKIAPEQKWRKMSTDILAKCAEASALRQKEESK